MSVYELKVFFMLDFNNFTSITLECDNTPTSLQQAVPCSADGNILWTSLRAHPFDKAPTRALTFNSKSYILREIRISASTIFEILTQ